MAGRAFRLRWPKRRRAADPVVEASAERTQASVLIHLGGAWRAHQDGEPVRAVRHLRLAVQAIMVLIEQWSTQETGDQ